MLTDQGEAANAPPRAVMLSIAEIAKRDGVSKPTVSIRVKRLVEQHGLTVERNRQGHVAAVNVAEYDHLRDRFGDATKAQAPRRDELPLGGGARKPEREDSLEEAQRQRAWIEAERARMHLGVTRKELLPAVRFNQALDECGVEIARTIDRLAASTDDIAVAAGRDGAHGVRVLLKSIAQRMRDDIATALAAIAAEAPELEEPQSQQEGLIPGGAGE